jgi:small subunit ribosomal protein S16
MVKIRLARHGKTKSPFNKIVVADGRFARDGRFIEQVGTHDPKKAEHGVKIKLDRVAYWLSRGAQPSETVAHLIAIAKSAAPQA